MRISCVLIFGLFALVIGCNRLPEASLTIKVVDENGKPISGAEVGLGFEQGYKNGEPIMFTIIGISDSNGTFVAKARTSNYISYGAVKNGYYRYSYVHRFKTNNKKRWQPWNPEVKVVLRKIENPVPMYARRAELEMPVLNKEIGFDLLEYDWIPPYGKGEYTDILFKATRKWKSEWEFDGSLAIRFPGAFNGIQLVKEGRSFGSKFKLPRFAPEEGYKNQIQKHIIASPGRGFDYDYAEDNNYIFRIRSESKDGKLVRAMYGKLQGDFSFGLKGSTTASIGFKYFLNPDYTRNLEFDPKQNLFSNLNSTERVGIE